MVVQNLNTLRIHEMTQAQYDREYAAGNIEANSIYLIKDGGGTNGKDVYSKAEIDNMVFITTEEIDVICGYGPEAERLEGDGQEFYTLAPSTLSFRSTAPLNELQDIQINGQTVDPANYELEEGSTIVKLKYDYLSTLDAGNYELSVVSDSKTVNGDFIVTAPELNEYGFYYNVPYYGTVLNLVGDIDWAGVFIFNRDGVGTFIKAGVRHISTFTWIMSNSTTITIISSDTSSLGLVAGEYTGIFSANGSELRVLGVGQGTLENSEADCIINSSDAVFLDGLLYFIHHGDYAVLSIDDSKSSIEVKTGFYDKPTTTLLMGAVMQHANLTTIILPDSITSLAIQSIYKNPLLTSIIFKGTMAQWNAISKGPDWNRYVPATYVQCSDGQVAI